MQMLSLMNIYCMVPKCQLVWLGVVWYKEQDTASLK
jgi:hypothetical protein